MPKIVPHLWFDKEAVAAANFYVKVFPNSKINSIQQIKDTPSGDCDIVSFELNGFSFMSISAGPFFKINPSISFFVNFDPSKDKNAKENLQKMWKKLSENGKVLMPLEKYPFSELYGWIQDQFGLSWQLILTNPAGEERPFIAPCLLFVGKSYGHAEEALNYYLSVFKNSKKGTIQRYPAGMPPHTENTLMFGDFKLENRWIAAMDGPGTHDFAFNEAISFIVNCDSQEEIDYFWKKLSHVKESEQCGWCKDKFGISWQINPNVLGKYLSSGNPETTQRVTQAFLKMKKFTIAELKRAFEGK